LLPPPRLAPAQKAGPGVGHRPPGVAFFWRRRRGSASPATGGFVDASRPAGHPPRAPASASRCRSAAGPTPRPSLQPNAARRPGPRGRSATLHRQEIPGDTSIGSGRRPRFVEAVRGCAADPCRETTPAWWGVSAVKSGGYDVRRMAPESGSGLFNVHRRFFGLSCDVGSRCLFRRIIEEFCS